MKRRVLVTIIIIFFSLSAIIFLRSKLHRIYLPAASGIVAKQVCSLHFISGFSHKQARSYYLDPLAGDFANLIFSTINARVKKVRATILGLYPQTAVFRRGIGCSLIHDGSDFDRNTGLSPLPPYNTLKINYTHRAAHFDTLALEAALETSFKEVAGEGRNTLAVAVLHEGNLVAERYAKGITPSTPLHGWSMAKSLTVTLAGTMIYKGEIGLKEKGILNNPGLKELTLEHLLGMTSGLDLTETGDGWDPNSRMLFTQSDMAEWASNRKQLHEPGDQWAYMSGNTILAMRTMQDRLGSTLKEQIEGVRRRVFTPLGMHSAILETDEAGTLQGSSYLYATAHDWARLGQLYLDNGKAGNRQIFHEDWVDIVTTPTPGSRGGYGLGFWLGSPGSGAPAKGFYMSGFQGQVVYIFPENKLVIVRLGATNFVNPGVYTLAEDVIAALRSDSGYLK